VDLQSNNTIYGYVISKFNLNLNNLIFIDSFLHVPSVSMLCPAFSSLLSSLFSISLTGEHTFSRKTRICKNKTRCFKRGKQKVRRFLVQFIFYIYSDFFFTPIPEPNNHHSFLFIFFVFRFTIHLNKRKCYTIYSRFLYRVKQCFGSIFILFYVIVTIRAGAILY